MINTAAFPSLPSISSNWTNIMKDASTQNATHCLPSGLDPTIIAGYEAQKPSLVDLLSSTEVGSYELLNSNIGLLAVSAMHPFYRGSVHILSINPLQQPVIDRRYCTNPLGCQILVEALLFNNKIVNTSSKKILQAAPYSPLFQNSTAETLIPAIRSGIRTEFHGSGTTSMMPLDLEVVVDPHLRVCGTKIFRIADAGVIPLISAAHL
jgi:choline dehydrogenase